MSFSSLPASEEMCFCRAENMKVPGVEPAFVLTPSMNQKHFERQKHTKTMPAVAKEAVFTLERRSVMCK